MVLENKAEDIDSGYRLTMHAECDGPVGRLGGSWNLRGVVFYIKY
jgi:hypothetical protein